MQTFAVTRSHVYVTGYFSRIGGQLTGTNVVGGAVAALDPTTGNVLSWQPPVFGDAETALVIGNRVIAGGNGLAAFDGDTATLQPWTPATTQAGQVEALGEARGLLYVASTPNREKSGTRTVDAYDEQSGELREHTVIALDGSILAIAGSDKLLLLGGTFTRVRRASSRRHILARARAYDGARR